MSDPDELRRVSVSLAATGMAVRTCHLLGENAARLDAEYRICSDGTIRVDAHCTARKFDLPFLPRLGRRFSLAEVASESAAKRAPYPSFAARPLLHLTRKT
jgi:hypothetical protein